MNTLKVGLLLTALFVLVGQWVGGTGGMVIALGLALAMNVGSYWFSDRLVLRMTRAVPLTPDQAPDLHAMTERLAERAGIPMPRLYLVPDPQPNAFATGRSPAHGVVAVNQGLLDLLTRREVEGVIAHEIGHIKHRDTLTMAVVAALAGAVMTLANLAQWSALFGGSDEEGTNPLALLVVAIVAPFAAMMVQFAVSRAREYEADATAADLAGSPDGLVGALQKLGRATEVVPSSVQRPQTAHLCIANPLAGGRLAGLFSTHPPMEERVARLLARDAVRSPRLEAISPRLEATGLSASALR
ncbi:zinc metalloprotease HtpX [Rubrivirga marina]|uniref:Protease HtpX homolog n=1 Tax=Rubrivirga marina TaxID=1196024 RepID=A0A271IXT6_9BACT|nr:zinc metalloprotease HtpX [Rubrivirga marina]PAP75897.1 protease HtpX [Rubrivirga marina]